MSSDVLSEWTEEVVLAGYKLREQHLRALIQPKPRWLPERIWRRVLRRLLVIEERET